LEIFLKDAFNKSNLAIVFWNGEGKVVLSNPAAQTFFKEKDLENENFFKLISNSDKKIISDLVNLKNTFQHINHNIFIKFNTSVLSFSDSEKIYQTVCSKVDQKDIAENNHMIDSVIEDLYAQKSVLQKRESTLRLQNIVLLQLAKSAAIDSGDLEQAIREITEAATIALDCERSSIWFYNDDKSAIIAKNLFEKNKDRHTSGAVLEAKDFPRYFNYLNEERILAAGNASVDGNTSEFTDVYLRPLGIISMLDSPIRIEGKMVGVLCNETVGNRKDWTIEEQSFASSLTDLVSRAVDSYERNQARQELKKANEELESRVEIRTRELQEKMSEVMKLKLQQDGDYYLTTLILNPLCIDLNNSTKIKTEYFVEQKKQFEFRNKINQLGGDIVICGNIKFWDGNDKYLFFANADAMGKSMQGAGGAIVFGSLLNSIVAQAARKNRILQISPEDWLTGVYNELHSAFKSFVGLMLISTIIGVINERTGEMIYFNAEHPHPVLYRDGMAEYIEPSYSLMKIGTEMEKNFEIQKYILRPGDILLIGSDGKDDILLIDENSKRTMNSEGSLFLNLVKKSNAELPLIISGLKELGDLTDDLSILKIQFQPLSLLGF
jgi:serine phosphatase RsbU (regulator of sigma subunit)